MSIVLELDICFELTADTQWLRETIILWWLPESYCVVCWVFWWLLL